LLFSFRFQDSSVFRSDSAQYSRYVVMALRLITNKTYYCFLNNSCQTRAESEEALGLKLQPNLASSEVSIDLSGFAQEQAVQVLISDMTGTLFVNQQVSLSEGEKQVSLPVRHLHQGLFLVRVQGSKTAQTAKLIITR